MGKKIDAYCLTVLMAICYYLYFFQATQGQIVSLLAALFCCVITRKTIKRIYKHLINSKRMKKQRYCKQAKSIIMELACAEPASTCERLQTLLKKSFQEHYCMELIQAHPDEKLTASAVFHCWKQHRNEEKLLICATCNCEAEVRMMASSLCAPRVAIVDAAQLKRLMAEHPAEFPLSDTKKKFNCKLLKWRLIERLFNRRNVPRCILFGFSSILMYILSGNVLYLFSTMFLFIITLFSLRHSSKTPKLF